MTFTGRSFYRVLTYFPDRVNGERINLAVIAYDEHEAHARVLQDWSRVQAFGQTAVTEMLEEFAHGLESWTTETARGYRASDHSSLELTEPRASIVPAAELIDRIAARMLVEPKPAPGEWAP